MTGDPSANHELTLRAILVGAVIGAVLAAGNVYMGLKSGFADSGNVPAAVLGYVLLVVISRGRTGPLENNVTVATATAAAIMAPAAGLIGPIPALALMGRHPAPLALIGWSLAVAALGLTIGLFLHRWLLIAEKLPFPSGAAAAELIRKLHALRDAGPRAARWLLASAALAGAVTWFRDGKPTLIPAATLLPIAIAGVPAAALSLGVSWSPLLASTGLLIGARGAVSILVGALIAWVGLAPVAINRHYVISSDYGDVVSWLLWPGVGLMMSGAITSVLVDWRVFSSAVRDMLGSSRASRRALLVMVALGAAVIALTSVAFGASLKGTAFAVVMATIFSAVCARLLGETDFALVGPLGGVMQLLSGAVDPGSTTTALGSGSIVNGAGSGTTTVLLAFKSGLSLGSSLRRLLLAQLVGLVVGAAVAVPSYLLIARVRGLGTAAMPAANALSWKATAEVAAKGIGAIPASAATAALVACVAGVLLTLLARRTRLPFPSAIALGSGFLIPASYAVTLALGGLVAATVARRRSEEALASFAAGGIAGESLVGIATAALISLGILGP